MKDDPPRGPAAARIRDAVRARYREVARSAEGCFPYPVGREGLRALGYEAEGSVLDLPAEVVDRFVGVGGPLRLRPPGPGDRVLDVGCGAGLDALLAARLVGPRGRVTGIDLTPEMLALARAARDALGLAHLDLVEGSAEALPFPDASFDLAISNGVLNLVPDKGAALREIRRVLRPGGALAAADLVVVEAVPPEVLADLDAWST